MPNANEQETRPPTISVMCNRIIAGRLKVIADRRGLSMAEALDQYGGAAVEREYRKVVREMDDELNPAAKG